VAAAEGNFDFQEIASFLPVPLFFFSANRQKENFLPPRPTPRRPPWMKREMRDRTNEEEESNGPALLPFSRSPLIQPAQLAAKSPFCRSLVLAPPRPIPAPSSPVYYPRHPSQPDSQYGRYTSVLGGGQIRTGSARSARRNSLAERVRVSARRNSPMRRTRGSSGLVPAYRTFRNSHGETSPWVSRLARTIGYNDRLAFDFESQNPFADETLEKEREREREREKERVKERERERERECAVRAPKKI